MQLSNIFTIVLHKPLHITLFVKLSILPYDKRQLDMFVKHDMFVKDGCPQRQQSQNMTPPHLQGHVISVRCEQTVDELTFRVW